METSKVQVEYSDPSGVLSSIDAALQSFFPLRNLHWNSSTRPLRSIDFLHIELTPDPQTLSAHLQSGQRNVSNEATRASNSTDGISKRERRHQIPGLRQTPYLKIYFLQCDDVEVYRASSRPELREWVNKQSAGLQNNGSKSKQEKHDAFEWLIVYVEGNTLDIRRVSNSVETEKTKKPGTSIWKPRGSKSVMEKVRSDFNGPSKHAMDRVAQVSVWKGDEDVDGTEKIPSEEVKGLDDLVGKMKTLILASFDLRVQQYEEDIKEKELQRYLPGWNFNTFFVLKEGLARGFESVGLVEDALLGYHELAVGLEAVIAEQLSDGVEAQRTAHFQACTDDLQRSLAQSLKVFGQNADDSNNTRTKFADLGSWVLDTDRKPFRNLILENNISIFDFENYVFARRISLLLRQADGQAMQMHAGNTFGTSKDRADHAEVEKHTKEVGPKNQLILAKICHLSLTFIGSAAQEIRRDLENSMVQILRDETQETGSLSACPASDIIDNLVASWIFSACQSVLDATDTASLAAHLYSSLRRLRRSERAQGTLQETKRSMENGTPESKQFPRRTSSLSFRSPSTEVLANGELSESVRSPKGPEQESALSLRAGMTELAGARGDLLALARRTLSALGSRLKGWHAGLSSILPSSEVPNLQEVKSDTSSDVPTRPVLDRSFGPTTASLAGVVNARLRAAFKTKELFIALYEDMTALTLAHYKIAERHKMAEAVNADLAVLYFDLQDFDIAVTYFKQLSSFYDDKQWLVLSTTMLNMWADCLRELGNNRESIFVALRALESGVGKMHPFSSPTRPLGDLIKLSENSDEQVIVPWNHYFADSRLGRFVYHHPQRDGFEVVLYFQYLLEAEFQARELGVLIRGVGRENAHDLWLFCERPTRIHRGSNTVRLLSNTMSPGWYVLSKISLRVGKITFVDEGAQRADTLLLPDARNAPDALSRPEHHSVGFLVWPQSRNLCVQVSPAAHVDLSRPRSISIIVSSGWNEISSGYLSLRPASAGLRLHNARAVTLRQEQEVNNGGSQTGDIALGAIANDEQVLVVVPFDLQSDLREVSVHLEVTYVTKQGQFKYICSEMVPLDLSLAVNVQDTFKSQALFSRFTIGSAAATPVQILSTQVLDNEYFKAHLFPTSIGVSDVFTRQPLSLIAEIRRRAMPPVRCSEAQIDKRLYLDINYQALDQEMMAECVRIHLTKTLALVQLERYSRILSEHLQKILRTRLSAHDLEACGLRGQFKLPRFEECSWDDILRSLDPTESSQLREVLQVWHKTEGCIALQSAEKSSLTRQLTVPVDLPELRILHSVHLSILSSSQNPATQSWAFLGQAISAELSIEHSRRWSHTQTDDASLDFCYDLHAELDTWLIGGQRSAYFSAREDERLVFTVLLLPQRTGHLLLPSISIHPSRSKVRTSEPCEKAAMDDALSSDIDYANQADTVFIVPNTSSTTVEIDLEESTGGVSLVEIHSRNC